MQIPKAIPVQVTDVEASSFSPDAEQPVRVVFSALAGDIPTNGPRRSLHDKSVSLFVRNARHATNHLLGS